MPRPYLGGTAPRCSGGRGRPRQEDTFKFLRCGREWWVRAPGRSAYKTAHCGKVVIQNESWGGGVIRPGHGHTRGIPHWATTGATRTHRTTHGTPCHTSRTIYMCVSFSVRSDLKTVFQKTSEQLKDLCYCFVLRRQFVTGHCEVWRSLQMSQHIMPCLREVTATELLLGPGDSQATLLREWPAKDCQAPICWPGLPFPC